MKKLFLRILSFALSVSLVFSMLTFVSAEEEEVYISELRLVYADSYEKAKEKLADSNFDNYRVFNANLNSNTGETGVWLCYKTTTNIEDAITDVSAMYMDGGYQEGNYQAMIEASRKEYIAMSEIYLAAVDYFAEAYEAGSFLAESAYRQLNFFVDNDDHGGDRIGDIFLAGIDSPELATMFMEGNSYVLRNIRALLAQGTAYNESGLTYIETVGEMAALYNEDPECFEDFENYEEFDALSLLISASVTTFGDMMRELKAVEAELNYEDEEDTDTELRYVEYQFIANLLRSVKYQGENTLYDFCLSYTLDETDLSPLYPLAAALNKGQAALTKVNHYYDIVRYSMSELPEELMDSEIAALEEKYDEKPMSIYAGVDRSIYSDTYALTSDALRADAYSESGFEELLTTGFEKFVFGSQIVVAAGSGIAFFYGVYRAFNGYSASHASERAATASAALQKKLEAAADIVLNQEIEDVLRPVVSFQYENYTQLINGYVRTYLPNLDPSTLTFAQKIDAMDDFILNNPDAIDFNDYNVYKHYLKDNFERAKESVGIKSSDKAAENASQAASAGYSGTVTSGLLFIGGAIMIVSAVGLYLKIDNYYNPDYSDVPVALVDLINTVDGDRYIKYDSVLEIKERGDGEYIPADTNAYEAQRWVALYYTKSYEAGNPLLADVTVSHDTHYNPKGYKAVHMFGEEICYNLNKYNFDSDSDSIYLCIKQSEKQKSAAADVPQVVGSMMSEGFVFLAAGIGAILGIGVTGGAMSLKKKKK